jgi:hypothetical protein
MLTTLSLGDWGQQKELPQLQVTIQLTGREPTSLTSPGGASELTQRVSGSRTGSIQAAASAASTRSPRRSWFVDGSTFAAALRRNPAP